MTSSKEIKTYVSVNVAFNENGLMLPKQIIWEDGRKYDIDRVKDIKQAAAMRCGGQGDRYTVFIDGHERYLYFECNCLLSVTTLENGSQSELYQPNTAIEENTLWRPKKIQKTNWQKQYCNMDEVNLSSFVDHKQLGTRGTEVLTAGTIGIIKAEGHQLIANILPDGVRIWSYKEWTPKLQIDYTPCAEIVGCIE